MVSGFWQIEGGDERCFQNAWVWQVFWQFWALYQLDENKILITESFWNYLSWSVKFITFEFVFRNPFGFLRDAFSWKKFPLVSFSGLVTVTKLQSRCNGHHSNAEIILSRLIWMSGTFLMPLILLLSWKDALNFFAVVDLKMPLLNWKAVIGLKLPLLIWKCRFWSENAVVGLISAVVELQNL